MGEYLCEQRHIELLGEETLAADLSQGDVQPLVTYRHSITTQHNTTQLTITHPSHTRSKCVWLSDAPTGGLDDLKLDGSLLGQLGEGLAQPPLRLVSLSESQR